MTRAPKSSVGGIDPEDFTGAPFDVLVIGGGITGAGVARHAAQAGLRTLLVEAGDFAQGTSSRSTKLIHGGLRYLAMGDFALVREGARERRSLLAMAPHLVEPRWMLVPAASLAGAWKLRIGISLYEWLGGVPAAERHQNLHGARLAASEPGLDTVRLPWASRYREYHADDARLVLATLRAAAADGAVIRNYARVDAITRIERGAATDASGRAAPGCRVCITDVRDGAQYEVEVPVVVNAAGPWVDAILDRTDGGARGAGSSGRSLLLSRGVHIVVDRARLPVQNMVMMTAADGRPVFAIARDDVTYLGTTDTAHKGSAEVWPPVEQAEVDYLLATANQHFPLAGLAIGDVRASWSGLRPLIHQAGKAPREMSRRDEIWRDGAMVTIAGGKLTGYRRMAEQAMRVVGDVLGRQLPMPAPLAPLPGGAIADVMMLVKAIAIRYQLEDSVAARLVHLYGSETEALLGDHPTPLSTLIFREEIDWALTVEGARTLEDVIYRRLRVAWYLPDELAGLLDAVADVMTERLGWSSEQRKEEIASVRARLAAETEFV